MPKINTTLPQELEDIDSVDINLVKKLNEDSFGERLRKSRIELGLSISDVASLCKVTKSVINGYECNRYNPTKNVLILLSSKFDMDYLCMEGYTKLIYNFDDFLDKLNVWIKENDYTRAEAADKIGISRTLFRVWFNGGGISISTYNKIKDNLIKLHLIE